MKVKPAAYWYPSAQPPSPWQSQQSTSMPPVPHPVQTCSDALTASAWQPVDVRSLLRTDVGRRSRTRTMAHEGFSLSVPSVHPDKAWLLRMVPLNKRWLRGGLPQMMTQSRPCDNRPFVHVIVTTVTVTSWQGRLQISHSAGRGFLLHVLSDGYSHHGADTHCDCRRHEPGCACPRARPTSRTPAV